MLDGPFAAVDVTRLAYGHLGPGTEISYAPDIRPETRIGARLIHARHLPRDEPLLVVYDSSLFGTATSGFVMTPVRFCWRCSWSLPKQIEWTRLRPKVVSWVKGRITIAGAEVPVDADLGSDLGRFLEEMSSRPGAHETTPYRAAGQREEITVEAITRLTWEKLGAMQGLHYHPFIPRRHLKRGRAAVGLSTAEDVAVLYEDRVQGAPQGFLVTPQRLYWHRWDRASASMALRDIVRVLVTPTSVVVGYERLPWTLMLNARPELPRAMGLLFKALGEEARGGARR
jgi:hypothetical protein